MLLIPLSYAWTLSSVVFKYQCHKALYRQLDMQRHSSKRSSFTTLLSYTSLSKQSLQGSSVLWKLPLVRHFWRHSPTLPPSVAIKWGKRDISVCVEGGKKCSLVESGLCSRKEADMNNESNWFIWLWFIHI